MVYTLELANRLYDFDISNSSNKSEQPKSNRSSIQNELKQKDSLKVTKPIDKSNVIPQSNKEPNSDSSTSNHLKINTEKKRKLTKFKSFGNENRIIDREDFGLLPLQQIKNLVLEKNLDTPKNEGRKETMQESEQKINLFRENTDSIKRDSLKQIQNQSSKNELESFKQNQKRNSLNDLDCKQSYKNSTHNLSLQKYHTQTQFVNESLNDTKLQVQGDISRGNSNQPTTRKCLEINFNELQHIELQENQFNRQQHKEFQSKKQLYQYEGDSLAQEKALPKGYLQNENQLNNIVISYDTTFKKKLSQFEKPPLKPTIQFESQSTKNLDLESEQRDFCNQNSLPKNGLNTECDRSENMYQIKLKNVPSSIIDLNSKKLSSVNGISTNQDTLTLLSPQNTFKKNSILDTNTSFEKPIMFKNNLQTQNTNLASNNNTKKNRNFIFEKLGFYDTKTFLEKELSFIMKRDRSLMMNCKYIINKLTCGKCYNTHEIQLLNRAKDRVREDLDIFVILDRLKEMEKFKKLFLSNEQQVLFNFFPKPLIKVEDSQQLLNRHSLKHQEDQNKNVKEMKKKTKKMKIKAEQMIAVSKAVAKFKTIAKKSDCPSTHSDYQKLFNCYEKLFVESQMKQIVYLFSGKYDQLILFFLVIANKRSRRI